MNSHDFRMLPSEMNLDSHRVSNPLPVAQHPVWKCHQNENNSCYRSSDGNQIFRRNETPGPGYSSPRTEIQSEPSSGYDVSELSKENTNAKQRVGNNQLVVHIDKSMCHNGRKIR
jgi:hypothetical protein